MRDMARRGWDSSFPAFHSVAGSKILASIRATYPNSSPEEVNSWHRTVPTLQREVGEVVQVQTNAGIFTAVMEYELPMESRRADAVLLLHDGVVVVELKGKSNPSDADIDQAHAYARDLSCYHRDCHDRDVHAVLVPTRMRGHDWVERGVRICPPAHLDKLVGSMATRSRSDPITAGKFLQADAYRPLPSLVRAARELFFDKRPPQLWRSAANTDRTVDAVRRIIGESHATGTRRLILVRGVPGSGKTLVGLRVAHMPQLDELSTAKDTTPAVFLSGNGPLVQVLQYVLRGAGGGGKTFVRPIRDYVRRYSRGRKLVPKEHVLMFDEAQRAHDRERVADVHNVPLSSSRSEPHHFVDFAERIRDWSVVVGLIGDGQEIHLGEESGLALWCAAIRGSSQAGSWTVHGPGEMADSFEGLRFEVEPDLNLDVTIRSHFASHLHQFVKALVGCPPAQPDELRRLAVHVECEGHDLRITRDLETAKAYLRERYRDHPEARYGLMASSRDKDLEQFGVRNGFQATRAVKYGPWYNDAETNSGERSCRHLNDCVTEFGAQGLELDAVLLAWGTDFQIELGTWSIRQARGYRRSGNSAVRNPLQLRANAYRVLLTRGRDAHVVFIPEIDHLDQTYSFLVEAGFRPLR